MQATVKIHDCLFFLHHPPIPVSNGSGLDLCCSAVSGMLGLLYVHALLSCSWDPQSLQHTYALSFSSWSFLSLWCMWVGSHSRVLRKQHFTCSPLRSSPSLASEETVHCSLHISLVWIALRLPPSHPMDMHAHLPSYVSHTPTHPTETSWHHPHLHFDSLSYLSFHAPPYPSPIWTCFPLYSSVIHLTEAFTAKMSWLSLPVLMLPHS